MRIADRRAEAGEWLTRHLVDGAFAGVVAFWLWYVMRLTRGFYFWNDDLVVLRQAGSWNGVIQPYNQALTLPTLIIWRVCAAFFGLSFTPLRIVGALSLAAVAVTYFATTRSRFGSPLAAVLAMPLLWATGMNLRPVDLNHFLALAGGIVCAAALERGRRADGVLAVALVVSLGAAGGGIVVAGACLVHCAMVRPHLRRWTVVVLAVAPYLIWLVVESPGEQANSLSAFEKLRVVREFFLEPFSQVGFRFVPLVVVLVVAFFAWGAMQLRQGLVAGANFVSWTAAAVAWPVGLIHSRGAGADPHVFRYAIVSLGFVLLAIVPRRPIRWPGRMSVANRRWIAASAVVVLAFGAVRALDAGPTLRSFSVRNADVGAKAKGTMLVLLLGPGVVPDPTPIPFFGFRNPHGTAGDVRALVARYGSPWHATAATIDRELVAVHAASMRLGWPSGNAPCTPLAGPVDLRPTSVGEADIGERPPGLAAPGPLQYRLWTKTSLTINVRRFGDRPVPLARLPAGRFVYLTLPALASEKPWTLIAVGACLVR